MKTISMMTAAMGILAAACLTSGCGASSATSASATPIPNDTPAPGDLPQLRAANLHADLGRSSDPYEPNDTTPYYLGAGTSYTITDAYLDPVDVIWTMDVVNDGGEVAQSFDVDLHVGDKVLVATLDGIGAGETRTISFTSSDADAGTLTAWGEVDARGEVTESDEQDNTTANVDATVVADQDCFSVYQISGGTLSVTLDQLPADFDLELLDPNGALVASSRNAGLAAESLSFTATASGNWIVRVVGYNGARSAAFPYRLQIDAP